MRMLLGEPMTRTDGRHCPECGTESYPAGAIELIGEWWCPKCVRTALSRAWRLRVQRDALRQALVGLMDALPAPNWMTLATVKDRQDKLDRALAEARDALEMP